MHAHRLPAIICAALLPLTSFAVPITYELTGQVSMAGGSAPPEGEMFVPIIPFGADFTASFTYDDETLPSFQSPDFTWYLNPITAATISFGPGGSLGVFDFAPRAMGPTNDESSYIGFLNDAQSGGAPFDQFFLGASLGNRPDDPVNMFRYLSFGTIDSSALQISAGQTLLDPLPLDAPPNGFHQLAFGYTLYDDAGSYYKSADVMSQQITIRQVTSVPEPATWSLLGAGLAGIWFAMRRRARRAPGGMDMQEPEGFTSGMQIASR